MVQAYLPAISEGDLRVILVEGEAQGTLNRIPAKGETRANLPAGSQATLGALSPRGEEIVARLAPVLREQGIVLAGVDIIGDYMTEINITSPTGLPTIKALGGADIVPLVWEAINARLKERG